MLVMCKKYYNDLTNGGHTYLTTMCQFYIRLASTYQV